MIIESKMKKQELIHLHGLLVEVEDFYEEAAEQELELNEYNANGVDPNAIHKSKKAHKNAIKTLAAELNDEIPENKMTIPA